jgi:hypothetical protein
MMFLRDTTWQAIRDQFSEAEKATMNAAIEGEVICPRGFYLGPSKLGESLYEKLQGAAAAAEGEAAKRIR